MMVSDEQRAQFERDGYFILDAFFTPEEIAGVTRALDVHSQRHQEALRSGGAQGISRPGEISFTHALAEQDPAVAAFCRSPKMVGLMRELIGPDVRLYWNQTVYKLPETPREFPWHQDNGYTPVEPEQYYTCWLALTDATVENGCVWVLPGSHHDGTLPHVPSDIGLVGYQGKETGIPVPIPSGSMIVFSSLLLHRSGPNLSQGERKAYIMQYAPAEIRHGKTGEPFSDRMWVVRDGKAVND